MAANPYSRAIIPINTALSNAIDIGSGSRCIGLMMPAGWTTAGITFQVALAMAGPWANLYDDSGVEVTLASANVLAGRAISVAGVAAMNTLAPWRYLKLRSGTGAAPVNQVAERLIEVTAEG